MRRVPLLRWLPVLGIGLLAACASAPPPPPPADPAPQPREIYRAPTVRPNIPGAGPNFGDVVDESKRRRQILDTIDSIHGEREF